MKIKSLLAIAALLTCAGANANLLVNGNFESGANSPWIFSGNAAIVTSAGGAFWYGAGSAAQDGRYAVAFNYGDLAPNGGLSQTFATQADTSYVVNFNYGATSGGTQTLRATVLDAASLTSLTNFSATSSNFGSNALANFLFSFRATGSQSTLRFADVAQNATRSLDGVLDNVTVNAIAAPAVVPEPGSIALLSLGLLGLALGRRSKR
jgi:hypothetical protein